MKRQKKVVIVIAVTLLATVAVGLFVLHRTGVPQNYTLHVTGPAAKPVIGELTVDGRRQKVSASLPISFDLRASNIQFAFAPADATTDEPFAVHVNINGDEWGHCINMEGVKGSHERTGIGGWGINGGGIGGLSAIEVAQLRQ
jgi:hypothetical protein